MTTATLNICPQQDAACMLTATTVSLAKYYILLHDLGDFRCCSDIRCGIQTSHAWLMHTEHLCHFSDALYKHMIDGYRHNINHLTCDIILHPQFLHSVLPQLITMVAICNFSTRSRNCRNKKSKVLQYWRYKLQCYTVKYMELQF